jgi:hypothetical protein
VVIALAVYRAGIDKIISDLQARKELAVERVRRKRWQRVIENAAAFNADSSQTCASEAMAAEHGPPRRMAAYRRKCRQLRHVVGALSSAATSDLGGAGSTGGRNTGVKSLCRGLKLQGLTWSFVELTSHFVQIGLRVHRQVGALRKVLSQQAIASGQYAVFRAGVKSYSLSLELLFETGRADVSVRGEWAAGNAFGGHCALNKTDSPSCRSLTEHSPCHMGTANASRFRLPKTAIHAMSKLSMHLARRL